MLLSLDTRASLTINEGLDMTALICKLIRVCAIIYAGSASFLFGTSQILG